MKCERTVIVHKDGLGAKAEITRSYTNISYHKLFHELFSHMAIEYRQGDPFRRGRGALKTETIKENSKSLIVPNRVIY